MIGLVMRASAFEYSTRVIDSRVPDNILGEHARGVGGHPAQREAMVPLYEQWCFRFRMPSLTAIAFVTYWLAIVPAPYLDSCSWTLWVLLQ